MEGKFILSYAFLKRFNTQFYCILSKITNPSTLKGIEKPGKLDVKLRAECICLVMLSTCSIWRKTW